MFRHPNTPAQGYATVAGLFLVPLGILSLVIDTGGWGTVGNVSAQPQFLIWAVSGWTTIFWIVMGALALLAVPRLASARSYALFAGVVFAVFAVWGFIDTDNVMSIFAADTTNNITHAILAVLGFAAGLMPTAGPPPYETEAASRTNHVGRFSRTEQRESVGHR